MLVETFHVTITIVAAGDVASYDGTKKSVLRRRFAELARIDITRISVSVAPASVVITVAIIASSQETADQVFALVSTGLANVTAASAIVGDTVVAVPFFSIVAIDASIPTPIPPPRSPPASKPPPLPLQMPATSPSLPSTTSLSLLPAPPAPALADGVSGLTQSETSSGKSVTIIIACTIVSIGLLLSCCLAQLLWRRRRRRASLSKLAEDLNPSVSQQHGDGPSQNSAIEERSISEASAGLQEGVARTSRRGSTGRVHGSPGTRRASLQAACQAVMRTCQEDSALGERSISEASAGRQEGVARSTRRGSANTSRRGSTGPERGGPVTRRASLQAAFKAVMRTCQHEEESSTQLQQLDFDPDDMSTDVTTKHTTIALLSEELTASSTTSVINILAWDEIELTRTFHQGSIGKLFDAQIRRKPKRAKRNDDEDDEDMGFAGLAEYTQLTERSRLPDDDGSPLLLRRLAIDIISQHTVHELAEQLRATRAFHSPHLLELHSVASDNQTNFGVLTIRMRWSLSNVVLRAEKNKRTAGLLERMRLHIMTDVAAGLEHLEAHGMAHLSLHPENILLTSDMEVKLSDWGRSRKFLTSHLILHSVATANSQRWHFLAPELLGVLDRTLPKPTASAVWSHALDVWAYGCVFIRLLTLEPLFSPPEGVVSQDVPALLQAFSAGTLRPIENLAGCMHVPPLLLTLLTRCTAIEAAERPSPINLSKELTYIQSAYAAAAKRHRVSRKSEPDRNLATSQPVAEAFTTTSAAGAAPASAKVLQEDRELRIGPRSILPVKAEGKDEGASSSTQPARRRHNLPSAQQLPAPARQGSGRTLVISSNPVPDPAHSLCKDNAIAARSDVPARAAMAAQSTPAPSSSLSPRSAGVGACDSSLSDLSTPALLPHDAQASERSPSQTPDVSSPRGSETVHLARAQLMQQPGQQSHEEPVQHTEAEGMQVQQEEEDTDAIYLALVRRSQQQVWLAPQSHPEQDEFEQMQQVQAQQVVQDQKQRQEPQQDQQVPRRATWSRVEADGIDQEDLPLQPEQPGQQDDPDMQSSDNKGRNTLQRELVQDLEDERASTRMCTDELVDLVESSRVPYPTRRRRSKLGTSNQVLSETSFSRSDRLRI